MEAQPELEATKLHKFSVYSYTNLQIAKAELEILESLNFDLDGN